MGINKMRSRESPNISEERDESRPHWYEFGESRKRNRSRKFKHQLHRADLFYLNKNKRLEGFPLIIPSDLKRSSINEIKVDI